MIYSNKKELIKELSERSEVSKAEVKKVYEALVSIIYDSVQDKTMEEIPLPSIGKFKRRVIPGRTGTSGLTGKEYTYDDIPTVFFRITNPLRKHARENG